MIDELADFTIADELIFLKTEEDLDDAMFGGPVRHRPEELSTLVRNTKFSRKEIQLIYRGFKQVSCSFK